MNNPKYRMPQYIYVANSFTGELFPVDMFVVRSTIAKKQKKENGGKTLWTQRNQTIIDLCKAGF